jgi:hypothetical protein
VKVPFLRRKQPEQMSEAERNRKLLASLAVKGIFWVMAAITAVFAVINLILGSSLFIPRSAEGVLDSVQEPVSYTWSSESIRRVTLAGEEQEQHAARSATVDSELNKYQLLVAGVMPERTFYVSDGDYTLTLDESSQAGGLPWTLITDYCGGAPSIPAETVLMPSAAEIKAAAPEIVSDEATFLGERAWEIEFEPTSEILEQLLWVPFFEAAEPDRLGWVLPADELDSLRAGRFSVDYAAALVTRDARRLAQIDVRFEIEDGSAWRVLAQIVPNPQERPLGETDLGEQPCENAPVSAPAAP